MRVGGASAKVLGGLVALFVLLALFWHPATPPLPASPPAAATITAAERPTPPPISDSARAVELLAEATASCAHPSAQRLRHLISDYGLIWEDEALVRVICRQVVVGMTNAQVRAAWGAPDQINTTETLAGVSEQWVYGPGQYVYLEAGRVTAVQTSR